jgi:hypothetical protein
VNAPTAMIERVAHAVMKARVSYGWTFGKRPRVMAIDLVMAAAAVEALRDPDHDTTALVVLPGHDRTEAVHTWNSMINGILGRIA